MFIVIVFREIFFGHQKKIMKGVENNVIKMPWPRYSHFFNYNNLDDHIFIRKCKLSKKLFGGG